MDDMLKREEIEIPEYAVPVDNAFSAMSKYSREIRDNTRSFLARYPKTHESESERAYKSWRGSVHKISNSTGMRAADEIMKAIASIEKIDSCSAALKVAWFYNFQVYSDIIHVLNVKILPRGPHMEGVLDILELSNYLLDSASSLQQSARDFFIFRRNSYHAEDGQKVETAKNFADKNYSKAKEMSLFPHSRKKTKIVTQH